MEKFNYIIYIDKLIKFLARIVEDISKDIVDIILVVNFTYNKLVNNWFKV